MVFIISEEPDEVILSQHTCIIECLGKKLNIVSQLLDNCHLRYDIRIILLYFLLLLDFSNIYSKIVPNKIQPFSFNRLMLMVIWMKKVYVIL